MASRIAISALRSRAPLSVRPVAQRSLHASSSVFRKKAAVVEEFEEDEFEQDSEEDMFAVSDAEPISMATNAQNAERRQAAFEQIKALYDLPRGQRKPEQMPVRVLATFVHSTSIKEEVEQLKEVLRMWRVSGLRVTDKTGEMIIGRCCNLGAPEVAVELASDKAQYGIPTPSIRTLTKLHQFLVEHKPTAPLPPLTTSYASPSLVLLRLALLSEEAQGAVSSTTKEELDRLVALTRSWKGRTSSVESKWAESARAKLVGLGAEWKAAAESLPVQ